jgi:phosphohistidine phosphatase
VRRLTLVRHAHAESRAPYGTDFERSLTERGKAEAEELGRYLLKQQWIPDLLMTSPAQRTEQTTHILATHLELSVKGIEHEQRLYLARPTTILDLVHATGNEVTHLMIVGHNPGISELGRRLAPSAGLGELATAAACTLIFDINAWAEVDYGTVPEVRLPDGYC